jgi:hypothetical protein
MEGQGNEVTREPRDAKKISTCVVRHCLVPQITVLIDRFFTIDF